MNFKDNALEFLETSLISFVLIVLIYMFIASVEVVKGVSMAPNFHTNERILVDKISKKFGPYQRGEVVVLIPTGESKHFIKRVIGLPGDVVKIYECKVHISQDSGQYVLEEPYLPESTCTSGGDALKEGHSMRLGEDEYIVLGDNRTNSSDSRYFGVAKKNQILGKVIFRFWPLNQLGFII